MLPTPLHRLVFVVMGSLAIVAAVTPAMPRIANAQAATTVFSTDFESGLPAQFSAPGSVIDGVQGYAGLGPLGNQFSGSFLHFTSTPLFDTQLSLTGLPAHDHLNLRFLLALIDSWDGTELMQVLVDGTNSNTASLVSSYAGEIVAAYGAGALAVQQNGRVLTRSPGSAVAAPALQVTARSRVWFNPDLYSRNYFVPGVIANIIMIVTLMLSALAIVREKEIGTMEQLMVTPMRPVELMLGKTLPFALVGLLDVVLVTGVALLVFHIPLHGSFLLLLFCAALFLMTTLGAGLFLSTISNTQQQAMMASFFFSTPAFMLSGFAFPIRNMPAAVQYLTYLNPVLYFIEIVRGIFLKGAGAEVLWPQMTCLAVYGVTVLGLSAMRFSKKLD
jgi:ABC-type multidrug transport system permease subunit